MLSIIRSELPFIAGLATIVLLWTVGSGLLADLANPIVAPLVFLWIFTVMVWGAFSVVSHADALADLLGEPLGTLVLTLSIVGIEVSLITAIMLAGAPSGSLSPHHSRAS